MSVDLKDTSLFVEMIYDECQKTYVSIIYRPYEYLFENGHQEKDMRYLKYETISISNSASSNS